MNREELSLLLLSDESYRIERTVSTTNMDKFQEAICAFANDLPGSRKKGYLLIGVHDDGTPSGLHVDDALVKKIAGIRSDGNILPLPVMNTEKVITDRGDVLVVEVTPSFNTPVRYRGRTFVRIGPRRDIASAEEERILTERCTASLPTFDTTPCREASLEDIELDYILKEYLSAAIDRNVLSEDKRDVKEQLASLRLYNRRWDCPTMAAIILFGKNPRYFLPGCYIQYVRFKGDDRAGDIINEREFKGPLFKLLPRLESFVEDAVVMQRPVPVSLFREKTVANYPYLALRELLMNACMHRDYQSNTPIRLYQYDNRIEIMNAGGLYGDARPENFPWVNAYRNPVIAEAMKVMKYVNMFNRGVGRVQWLLEENGSEKASFIVDKLTVFEVSVEDANLKDKRMGIEHLSDDEYKKMLESLEDSVKNSRSKNTEDSRNNVKNSRSNVKNSRSNVKNSRSKDAEDSRSKNSRSRKEEKVKKLLLFCAQPKSLNEIAEYFRVVDKYFFKRLYMDPLLGTSLFLVYPENPKDPKQKYCSAKSEE